jgi:hypothetical protein
VTAPTLHSAPAFAAGAAPAACPPWCADHDGSHREWIADEVDLQVCPGPNGEYAGRIAVLLEHRRPGGRYPKREVAISIDVFPDGENGTEMTPVEAEIAGHALLAMVAVTRGDAATAAAHRAIAEDTAHALLFHRTHTTTDRNGDAR